MSDDMISKPKARRVRLLCQIGAALFIAAAAGAVTVGVPILQTPSAQMISYADVETKATEIHSGMIARRTESAPADAAFPPDLALIEDSINQVMNAPKIKKPAEVAGPVEEGTKGPTAGPVEEYAKTRFVGTIGIGDRLMALLSAGGRQRILGEGQEGVLPLVDGASGSPPRVKVQRVSEDEVLLVEDGVERKISRATRMGTAVTTSAAIVRPRTDPPAARAVATDGALPGDRDNIKPVNPDDFRRDDGTVDYEALREAARERARQRQEIRRQQREEAGDEN